LSFSHDGKLLASGSSDRTIVIWDLFRPFDDERAIAQRPQHTDAEYWKDLANDDAAQAYRAMCGLANSKSSAPFLRQHLQPTPSADPKRLTQLIADLDSDQFAVRKKAGEELEKLEELAKPAMEKALSGQPRLELRRRLEQLLDRLEGPITSPEQLRVLRAIEVLEHIGSAEARGVLENLAGGAPEARVTQEAKASLGRLTKRNVKP
jgi:hypothetical protein